MLPGFSFLLLIPTSFQGDSAEFLTVYPASHVGVFLYLTHRMSTGFECCPTLTSPSFLAHSFVFFKKKTKTLLDVGICLTERNEIN